MLRVSLMLVTFFLASATGMTPERSSAPVGWTKAAAQDQKPGATAPGKAELEKRGEEGKETEETQTPGTPTNTGISGAESVFRLDKQIKADRRTVDELQGQLKTREEVYDAAAERMEVLKGRLENRAEALRKAEVEGRTDEVEGLKAEIEEIENEHALVKERFDLAFEGHRKTLEQIRALEEKIEKAQSMLDRLVGREVREKKKEPPVAPAPGVPASERVEAVPPFVPGIPGVQEEGAPAGKKKVPETLEQIEARKLAEEKEEEARRAAEVIVEYVEGEKILQEQIRLEQDLLKTAEANLEALEQLLEKRRKRTEEKIAAKAPKSEIRKIQAETRGMEQEVEGLREEIDKRKDALNDLNEQVQRLEEEQQAAIREAERRKEEAEEARRTSVWLQSPLYPKNIQRWAFNRGPRMFLILVAVVLILFVVRFTLKRTARVIVWRGRGEFEQKEKRATTLASTLTGAATGVIVIGGFLVFLQEAGMDVAALLGGAAVIGLAVAFGAQNLMRDFFNGFMILMEGQYELNDLVTIGEVTGVVERMSMRMTMLRDLEGRAHFIPNGQIKRVTNRTHGWAQAVFDVGVAYEENVDRVMGILMELAGELRRDPEFGGYILDEPNMLGVDDFGNAAFRVKFVMKTRPDKMWPVRREMLRRIKNKFDELGIRIPVQHHVVLQRNTKGVEE